MANVSQPLIQSGLLGEAIDRAPVLVLVADDEMRYVAVNETACETLGYTRDELLQLRVTDVARGAEVEAHFEDFLARRTDAGTVAIVRKDGTELRFEYRATEGTVAGMTVYVSVGWVVPD